MAARLRVLVVFGGRSAEHDVSRQTAVAVARALDPDRYEVVPVAITREGRWLLADEARAALAAGTGTLPEAFAVAGTPMRVPVEPDAPVVRLDAGATLPVDVVIPLVHGPYGEDGTLQGLLELAGLPYVGAGVLASAIGMDKIATKRMLRAAGLPVARAVECRAGVDLDALAARTAQELGFPCFVKPANMGSSVGVSKVTDPGGLAGAVDLALAYDEWVLVEEAIVGREIEVAILGDDPPEASVPGEVVPGAEFYDYADKYEDGAAELRVPAPLDAAATAEVRQLAVAAFAACRGEAMARVDFFYEPSGRGFVVNEINTIPGFTPISMYPELWAASGVGYPELLDRLVALALARHTRRSARAGRERTPPGARPLGPGAPDPT